MKKPLLTISDLIVSVEGKTIIQGLNLEIYEGEIHALMGPNGTGKSTLAKVLAGHPSCHIEHGSILFRGESLLGKKPEERASNGLFIGFQYPTEIKGLSNTTFLKSAVNCQRKARKETPLTDEQFETLLKEKLSLLDMKHHFHSRDVNEGFSGGEKKRNEILQMALLNPQLAILDETDSGLDIDALQAVSLGITTLIPKGSTKALVLITHYQRLLSYIEPDHVHVMMEGRIVAQGGKELAIELEKNGYSFLQEPSRGAKKRV